jgi:hypothetical protein
MFAPTRRLSQAYCVLHRLLGPRHSPCALIIFFNDLQFFSANALVIRFAFVLSFDLIVYYDSMKYVLDRPFYFKSMSNLRSLFSFQGKGSRFGAKPQAGDLRRKRPVTKGESLGGSRFGFSACIFSIRREGTEEKKRETKPKNVMERFACTLGEER